TVYDPVPLEALRAGDDIEVSGFFDSSGQIRATRIARLSELSDIELKGFVKDLDEAAGTFRLGDLVVDLRSAFTEGLPPGSLKNGVFVDVGADHPPIGNVLAANVVELEDPNLMADPGDALKVEGFVTAIVSATEFVVNGSQRVQITPETHFEHGVQADLAVDA